MLYPPSVPISKIFRAPCMRANIQSSLPSCGATLIDGSPAASIASVAASRIGSDGISNSLK